MGPQETIRAAEALFPQLLLVARQAAPNWRAAHEGEPPEEPWATPPDDERKVLVFINGHVGLHDMEGRKGGAWGIAIGWYEHERGFWRVHGRAEYHVTHWMELPAAPTPAARGESEPVLPSPETDRP